MCEKEYVGVREGARRLGISTSSYYKVVAAGKVRTITLPGLPTRYNAADLDAMLAASHGVAKLRRGKRGIA